MEQIKPGKYFEMTYTLSRVNPDGTEEALHEMTASSPHLRRPSKVSPPATTSTLSLRPKRASGLTTPRSS